MRKLNLVGKKIQMLTVISQEPYSGGRSRFNVRCECGTTRIVDGPKLNSGRIKSCGCYRSTEDGRKSCGLRHRLGWGESIRNGVIGMYKLNSKNRKLEFSLTDKQMIKLFESECFYCGRMPYRTKRRAKSYGDYTYNGIDRMDSSKGYTTNNCVSCCEQCNFLKNSYSKENFIDIIRMIYLNMKKKELL